MFMLRSRNGLGHNVLLKQEAAVLVRREAWRTRAN